MCKLTPKRSNGAMVDEVAMMRPKHFQRFWQLVFLCSRNAVRGECSPAVRSRGRHGLDHDGLCGTRARRGQDRAPCVGLLPVLAVLAVLAVWHGSLG